MLKLIPFIAVVILLISVIGAVVCSRYYSKPLVNISNVAKRMTTLDMTWKCEVNRKDEIGVLATSLNELAAQLSNCLLYTSSYGGGRVPQYSGCNENARYWN